MFDVILIGLSLINLSGLLFLLVRVRELEEAVRQIDVEDDYDLGEQCCDQHGINIISKASVPGGSGGAR